jgi:trimethylamine-N-oxide reductase (cytochrome c)
MSSSAYFASSRFSFHSQFDGKGLWNDEIPHHERLKDGIATGWSGSIRKMGKNGVSPMVILSRSITTGNRLAIATVTPRIIPGVVHSYSSGGGYDPMGEPGDPKTIDRGGTINQVTASRFISKNCPGMAPGSCLVEIERWEGGC